MTTARIYATLTSLMNRVPLDAGLAIKDFWKVDADTVVFVADPSLGNILNFNIGANIDLQVPPVSWSDRPLVSKLASLESWPRRSLYRTLSGTATLIVAMKQRCCRGPILNFSQCHRW